MIWKYIKAESFFPAYAPKVTNYRHKIRKKNGRGNPMDFSPDDIKLIRAGLKKMFKDNPIKIVKPAPVSFAEAAAPN